MNETTDKVFGQADAFAKVWSDFGSMWSAFASKMATAGLSFSADATPPEAARQVRAAMLKAMEEYCVEYMRSPQFLEAMKQGLETSVGARKQLNDFLTRARHELQGAAREDIDNIMLSIRHLETRMLDRMGELESRLEQINNRLDAFSGQPAQARAPGKRRGGASGPSKKRPKG